MNKKGFTLVEVMIAVAVVGILAVIAYPSYVSYKIKTHRIDTQAEMMQIARIMANYHMANNNYAGRTLANTYGASTIPRAQPLYDITLTDIDGVALTTASAKVRTWLLVAKPITGTSQANNGWICLNNQGQKYWVKGGTACVLSASSTWDDH
ncbi:type IV pilin protein [Acinetobacter venetianus]|uniref:type IV pilin protein n=1 Tax=Acinetobacter venetianus TaxID=52133 RepID=UPI003F939542